MNELPILFETHDLTQENLELLQIYEDIEFACIYDDQQELFSIYHRADEPLYLKITTQNYNKYIHASEGVEHVDYFPPPNAINIIEATRRENIILKKQSEQLNKDNQDQQTTRLIKLNIR